MEIYIKASFYVYKKYPAVSVPNFGGVVAPTTGNLIWRRLSL
ncbi:MAG: hypothetical protein AAB392_02895 [Patescibacteria group bacterium]